MRKERKQVSGFSKPNSKVVKRTTAEIGLTVENGGLYLREEVGTMRLPDGRTVEMSRSLNGMTLFARFEESGASDCVIVQLAPIYEKMAEELRKRTEQ